MTACSWTSSRTGRTKDFRAMRSFRPGATELQKSRRSSISASSHRRQRHLLRTVGPSSGGMLAAQKHRRAPHIGRDGLYQNRIRKVGAYARASTVLHEDEGELLAGARHSKTGRRQHRGSLLALTACKRAARKRVITPIH